MEPWRSGGHDGAPENLTARWPGRKPARFSAREASATTPVVKWIVRECRTQSAEETAAEGERLGRRLKRGDVVALFGNLGSGKTVFIRGMCRALGVTCGVHSPTFSMVHEYAGHVPVFHVDLYRVGGWADVASLGLDEAWRVGAIMAVEWAERAGDALPAGAIRVELLHGDGENERRIRVVELEAGEA